MPDPAPTIDAALFEGMFVRAVRPDPSFAAELKYLGFDVTRIQSRYRALGNLFVDGYFETIIGKILSVPLSVVSAERVIQRLPKSWKTARSDIQIDPPVEEAPQRWRVRFRDSNPLPDFFAGVVEGAS